MVFSGWQGPHELKHAVAHSGLRPREPGSSPPVFARLRVAVVPAGPFVVLVGDSAEDSCRMRPLAPHHFREPRLPAASKRPAALTRVWTNVVALQYQRTRSLSTRPRKVAALLEPGAMRCPRVGSHQEGPTGVDLLTADAERTDESWGVAHRTQIGSRDREVQRERHVCVPALC
jgi:hypothetical protein